MINLDIFLAYVTLLSANSLDTGTVDAQHTVCIALRILLDFGSEQGSGWELGTERQYFSMEAGGRFRFVPNDFCFSILK